MYVCQFQRYNENYSLKTTGSNQSITFLAKNQQLGLATLFYMFRRLKNFDNDVNQAQIINFFSQLNDQQLEEAIIAIDLPGIFRFLAYLRITGVLSVSNLEQWKTRLEDNKQQYQIVKQQFNERKFMRVYQKDPTSNYSFQAKLFEYKQVCETNNQQYTLLDNQNSDYSITSEQLTQFNNFITTPQNPYEYRHMIHRLEQNIKKDIDRLFSDDNYFSNQNIRVEIGQITAIYCYQKLNITYTQGLHEVCAICYRIVEEAIKNNPSENYTGTDVIYREQNYLSQDQQSNFMYNTSYFNTSQQNVGFSNFRFLELINKQSHQALTYLLLCAITEYFHIDYVYKNEDQISLIGEYFTNYVLKIRDPSLYEHLQRLHVENTHFERCFKVLFAREVALNQVQRLWDILVVYKKRVKAPNLNQGNFTNISGYTLYKSINYTQFFMYYDVMFHIYQINRQKLISSDFGQVMTIYSLPLLSQGSQDNNNSPQKIQNNLQISQQSQLQTFLKIIYEQLFMQNDHMLNQSIVNKQITTPINLHVNDIWQDAYKSTYDPVNQVCDVVLQKLIDIQTSHRLGHVDEVGQKLENLVRLLQVQPNTSIYEPLPGQDNFSSQFPPNHRLIEFELLQQQEKMQQK